MNDWIEKRVDEMLKALRRSGYFTQGIEEARYQHRQHGYAWDVALKIACDYWCR